MRRRSRGRGPTLFNITRPNSHPQSQRVLVLLALRRCTLRVAAGVEAAMRAARLCLLSRTARGIDLGDLRTGAA